MTGVASQAMGGGVEPGLGRLRQVHTGGRSGSDLTEPSPRGLTLEKGLRLLYHVPCEREASKKCQPRVWVRVMAQHQHGVWRLSFSSGSAAVILEHSCYPSGVLVTAECSGSLMSDVIYLPNTQVASCPCVTVTMTPDGL